MKTNKINPHQKHSLPQLLNVNPLNPLFRVEEINVAISNVQWRNMRELQRSIRVRWREVDSVMVVWTSTWGLYHYILPSAGIKFVWTTPSGPPRGVGLADSQLDLRGAHWPLSLTGRKWSSLECHTHSQTSQVNHDGLQMSPLRFEKRFKLLRENVCLYFWN